MEWSIINQHTSERRSIKSVDADDQFKYKISELPGGESLLRCLQCGSCTSDCPIARFSDTYRPRQIIRMAQFGFKNKVLSSDTLWLCTSCFTCTDHCPQDVKVANIIRVLRNLATQKDHIPPIFIGLGLNILKSGYAYKIPDIRIKRRKAHSLPPLPKCDTINLTKILNGVRFPRFLEEKEK